MNSSKEQIKKILDEAPEGATDWWQFLCDEDVGFYGTYDEDISFSREMWNRMPLSDLRKQLDKAEWNGEGLPPIGAKAVFSYADFELPSWLEIGQKVEIIAHQFNNSIPVAVFRVETTFGMEVSFAGAESFSKPELPEDKLKRDRLESAYELYCIMCDIEGYAKFDLTDFSKTKKDSAVWLAIVDKTKYRKEVE